MAGDSHRDTATSDGDGDEDTQTDVPPSPDGGPEKTVMVELTQEEYDSLSDTKKANGMTWKGMLLHAQRNLDC